MPPTTATTPAARAQRWLDGGDAPPPDLPGDEARALAWALKDACYAAWSSEPRRAAQAADLLATWATQHTPQRTTADQHEIDALAAWTGGIAQVTRGAMADAVVSFDLAAERFTQLGQTGPATQTQVPKIMGLSMLGRHAEAVACAERTQQAFVTQGDVRAASKVSLNLGSLHLRHDAYALAARHYRDAARLFARVEDREHSVMADIGLADALTELGDLAEAERIYARARVRSAAHGLPVLQARVDESQALLDLARGRYGPALAGFERARARYALLAMPQHLVIAEKQLAEAYLDLRLLPEAERLFRQILPRFDALDMPDDQAWTLAQLGRTLVLRGQPDAAAPCFADAAQLFRTQGNAAGQAAVTLARAELALRQGDATAAAEWARIVNAPGSQASADLQARAQGLHAQALLHTAQSTQNATAWAAAHAAFAQALADARRAQRWSAEAHSLAGLAQADQALGHGAAARAGFTAAAHGLDELRLALPSDETRHAFSADHLRPYRELLRYALQDHAESPSAEHAAAVLREADRLRARTLSARLVGGADTRVDDEATAALRSRVSWLARRAQGLENEGDSPSAALLDELRRSEHALLEQVRRARLLAGPQADDGLDTAALGAHLGPHDALLEYGVLDDELFACIARRTGITVHRHVARWSEVLQAAQALRFQLDALGHGATPLQSHLPQLTARCAARLQRLHALVWGPLSQCEFGERLFVVAPMPLSALPLHAMPAGDGVLGDQLRWVWLPSAGRLAAQRSAANTPAPRRALVIGDSQHLPHAETEAREVAQGFANADLRLGERASVDALCGESARHAGLIHLACHAQFRADSPRFSALHLRDGALTAEQVETLRLQAQVVVLSACDTAGGHHQPGDTGSAGDDGLGLVRAFLLAGAECVLASLWPVDDRVTREFMIGFYAAWREGLPPDAALQRAQAEVRTRYSHPFHWAAFALYGGG